MPAYDTIVMADQDNPTDVYLYTNRYRGDQFAQNAFFKYTMTDPVQSFYLPGRAVPPRQARRAVLPEGW